MFVLLAGLSRLTVGVVVSCTVIQCVSSEVE